MKTNLNRQINSKEDAIAYLTELYNNSEAYHPEDDASDIIWSNNTSPSIEESELMNQLMDRCFDVLEDPCEVLADLWLNTLEELRYLSDEDIKQIKNS